MILIRETYHSFGSVDFEFIIEHMKALPLEPFIYLNINDTNGDSEEYLNKIIKCNVPKCTR